MPPPIWELDAAEARQPRHNARDSVGVWGGLLGGQWADGGPHLHAVVHHRRVGDEAGAAGLALQVHVGCMIFRHSEFQLVYTEVPGHSQC